MFIVNALSRKASCLHGTGGRQASRDGGGQSPRGGSAPPPGLADADVRKTA